MPEKNIPSSTLTKCACQRVEKDLIYMYALDRDKSHSPIDIPSLPSDLAIRFPPAFLILYDVSTTLSVSLSQFPSSCSPAAQWCSQRGIWYSFLRLRSWFFIFLCYVLVPYTRSELAPPLIHANLVIVVVNMAPAISKLASDVQRYKGPVLAACGGVALAYAWLKSYGIQVGWQWNRV